MANELGLIKMLDLLKGKIRYNNKFNQIKNNSLTNPKFCIYSSFCIKNDVNLNNHWLAGFSETGVNFQIKLITKMKKPK